ncbi:MAG TPA: two-component regulator propeller domain-containing protein [Edaphocola sp.]|nr:two-component regulator propeller domain-containing protein [Edaphocola sp.]
MRLKILFFFILWTGLTGNGFAQKPFLRSFPLNERHVPVRVNVLLQDAVGFIYLGTENGLVRFNGRDFLPLTRDLKKPYEVLSLASWNGSVWAGTSRGEILKIYHHLGCRQVKTIKVSDSSVPIRCIVSGFPSKTVWLGTENGVFIIKDDTVRRHINNRNGLSDNFVYTICRMASEAIIGTDKGINIIDCSRPKAKIRVITTKNGLPDNIVRVIKRIPRTSRFWIGTQQSGIAIFNAERQKISSVFDVSSWQYGQVNDILPLNDRFAWVVTGKGYLLAARIQDDGRISIQAFHYEGCKFRSLIIDQSGNLWCGTASGFCMLTAEYLKQIPLPAPYAFRKVTALAGRDAHSLWLAQDSTLYKVYFNNDSTGISYFDRLPGYISCMYKDAKGRLWVGTIRQGLFYLDRENRLVACAHAGVLKKSSILSISGANDHLWVSTLTGVYELSVPVSLTSFPRVLNVYQKNSGIGSNYVYQLMSDHQGRIWMATDGTGVCMWNGKEFIHWRNPDSLDSKVAYTMTEDARNNVWVGTFFKGIYTLNEDDLSHVKRVGGVTDANISAIAANKSGQVIAVFERCIDEWYPQSRAFRHFNFRMGLNIDSTSNALNCLTNDEAGNVYIPYQQGILIFTNQINHYSIRSFAHIDGVTAMLQPLKNSEVSYNRNFITINFEGINYTNPERLNYRFKLEGLSKEWIRTNDEFMTYPNLPPGHYTFKVQASLDDHFNQSSEDSFSFTIKAPFWRQYWFYALLAVIFAVLIIGLIKIRDHRQQKWIKLRSERMDFEYEHLKSQVNPHFLFNSLNTLINLIEENTASAVAYTERLSALYQNILIYKNSNLILIKDEIALLSAYLHVQQTRFGDGLKVNINIEEAVLASGKMIPMVLQMLIENAIKHNVVSVSQPLVIDILSKDKRIIVSNPLRPKINEDKGAGIALINIKKRYRLLTRQTVHYGEINGAFVVSLPIL